MNPYTRKQLIKKIAQEIVIANIQAYSQSCIDGGFEPTTEEFHATGTDQQSIAAVLEEMVPDITALVKRRQRQLLNIGQLVEIHLNSCMMK